MRASMVDARHGVQSETVTHRRCGLLCGLIIICCWGYCSPPIVLIAAEESPSQASSSSRPIEVKATGRPFEPGVLYDAVNEKVLSSFRLWPKDESTISVERRPQKSIISRMYTSDSLEAKSDMLDVGGELKLSILSGLIKVGGSAKYLNEKKASSKYASVSLVISQTTEHDYYRFPATRANTSISEHALHDATLATHLVTGVTYGGRAIFEFQLEDQEDASRTEIKGKLEGALSELLSGVVSGELSVEGKVDNAELKRLSSVRCNFFGDFTLDKVPSTLGEAVEIMKDIPRLIEEARTPITATLVPIQHFTGTKLQRFAHQISEELVENAVAHYDELSTMQLDVEELQAKAKDSKLSNLLRLVSNFQKIISQQKTRVGNSIAKELPKIRGTGHGAEALTDYLASSASCLHGGDDELQATGIIAAPRWLEAQKSILGITKHWLQALNESGATLALDNADLSVRVAQQQDKCSLVILLPTVLVKPPYLKQLAHCFSGTAGVLKHPMSGEFAPSPAMANETVETQSVHQSHIQSAAAWADINSKVFPVGQKEFQSFVRFLKINQDILRGRVYVGIQQSPSISSTQAHLTNMLQQTPISSNNGADGQHHQDDNPHHHHHHQASSLLQTKVYCSGETPSQFRIPEPPQNIKINSCNVTDQGPICITIWWDEPASATSSTQTAPSAYLKEGKSMKHDAATGYLMRCRQAGPPKAAVTGSKADFNIFPWMEDIPIRLNVSMFRNPCICDKASDLSLSAADQRQQEFEFQIQTVTKSLGRSDWSKSIFHRIKVQDGNMDADQDVRLTKLMVVGGSDGSGVKHVEVIDLTSGESLTCPVPPALRDGPLTYGAVGAFIRDGKAVICAGENAPNKCYTYSNRMDRWDPLPGSLIHSLFYRAAVVLPDGRWWLTGGCCSSNQTEMLVFNEQGAIRSQAFVPLPRPARRHHMLLLNESAVVFVGGDTKVNDLWLFNIDTSEWTQLPSMPRAKSVLVAGLARFGHDGNSNNKQQQQLVVTGGTDAGDTSTLIFDFDANEWRNGRNNFPHNIAYAASVQYQDTFLVVGGHSQQKGFLDTIFQFDAKNEKWVQTSKKLLRGGRSRVAAFLVPDSYVQQCATG